MANNLTLDVLKPYVDQEANRDKVIAESVLAPKTLSYIEIQDGVKGPTTINLMTADVTFGDGTSCGFESTASAKVSQRQIVPALMRVGMEICEKEILGTYAQYQIKLKAGMEEIPFEEYLYSLIAKKVAARLEKFIWQGDKSEDETQFDGFLTILYEDGSDAKKVDEKATEMETVLAVYNALPNEAYGEDLVVFAAPSRFRKYVQELVAANMYHYNATDDKGEVTIPGTSTKVIEVPGLEGAETYVAARLSNLFAGLDIEDASESIKAVFDERTETFLLKMLFNLGVQVAFPNEVAYSVH